MHIKSLKRVALASAAISALASGGAGAQEVKPQAPAASSEAFSIETVVVTARRREETLFETPTTLTAISGDMLKGAGITSAKDIVALVPNAVLVDDPESYNTYINIRGIAQVDVQAEPNFGLYRNGLYAGGHRANLGAQVDIQRVEVLRGPQGGLYGRNAVGGAVNMVFAEPDDVFGGYARASYGSYDRFEVEGAINVPVSDDFAVRLTGWRLAQTGSEVYNETLKERLLASSDKGLRLGARYDLNKDLSITWMAEVQNVEGPSMKTFSPEGTLNGGILSAPETYNVIRRDTPSRAKTHQHFFSQKISYNTEIGNFALNTSYRKYHINSIGDLDQTAIPVTAGLAVRKTDVLRKESTDDLYAEALWTSRDDQALTWVVGASYFDETFHFNRIIDGKRDLTPNGFGIVGYKIAFPGGNTNVKTSSIAAFGSASYDITDELSVSAGLRWSQDTKKLDFFRGVMTEGITPAGNQALLDFILPALRVPYPTYILQIKDTFRFLAPSASIKYKVSDNVNLYASYSTGFRPGAFNMAPTSIETIPYQEEKAANYEVGMKSVWLDGKLNTNLAVFFMRQRDMLLSQIATLGGIERTYTANAGSANTYGVEFEMAARLDTWLNANLSVGYLHARFDDAVANRGKPSQLILNGLRIPQTRDWNVNFRLDAHQPINDTLTAIGSAAVRYEQGGMVGDYYLVKSYDTMAKIDMTAGVAIGNNTRVNLYVNNLLNQHISQYWYYSGATTATPGRSYGIQVGYDF